MLVGVGVGVDVGFAPPNLLAKATVDLPPARVSTISAIVNTSRQLGYVFGVTMLVAILETITAGAADSLDSFRRGDRWCRTARDLDFVRHIRAARIDK